MHINNIDKVTYLKEKLQQITDTLEGYDQNILNEDYQWVNVSFKDFPYTYEFLFNKKRWPEVNEKISGMLLEVMQEERNDLIAQLNDLGVEV